MIKCIKDFYCFSGKIRFTKGTEYNLKDNVIEFSNYHLHNPKKYKEFFIEC